MTLQELKTKMREKAKNKPSEAQPLDHTYLSNDERIPSDRIQNSQGINLEDQPQTNED